MGVDEGNLQVIDVALDVMILENCPISIVILSIHAVQYSTIVIIVYNSKCHRPILHYIMSCIV